jgi:hypothetical protein
MGKLVATYLVKVAVREDDDLGDVDGAVDPNPPTIAEIESTIAAAVTDREAYLTATATAERTDI